MKHLKISNIIGIGTAQLGADYGIMNNNGKLSDLEFKKILATARQSHIDTIDTATCYGDAEERLGCLNLDGFKIITKLSSNSISLHDEISASLIKLKKKQIYAALIHNSSIMFEKDGKKKYQELIELKKKKLIKKIGISIYSPDELDRLNDLGFYFDLIQGPLNYLDQRLASPKWVDYFTKNSIEFHARSIFLQGLLLYKANDLPKDLNSKFYKLWPIIDNTIRKSEINRLKFFIDFVRSFKHVSKIIIGFDSHQYLKEIINLLNTDQNFKYEHLTGIDDEIINPSKWKLNHAL
jgi:aryl-alcohol dehydrogenase-like predicted oxidoreductase